MLPCKPLHIPIHAFDVNDKADGSSLRCGRALKESPTQCNASGTRFNASSAIVQVMAIKRPSACCVGGAVASGDASHTLGT
ncbi:hypothetical protein MTO96_046828 [Rhipicephalus appendiculatus]